MTSHHHLFGVAAMTALGLACMAPTPVHAAGGLSNIETGAGDFGVAAAGYAARAQDASTAFTNPAGMVRIKGDDLVLGAQLLYGNLKFSPNGNTTVQGSDGGNAVGWLPGAGSHYVHSVSDDLKFGIGVAGNFGTMAEWDKDWVGRYYGTTGDLLGVTIMPSVAFKVNDEFSVGFGLNAMLGYLESKTAINNELPLGSTAGSSSRTRTGASAAPPASSTSPRRRRASVPPTPARSSSISRTGPVSRTSAPSAPSCRRVGCSTTRSTWASGFLSR
jgi:long-chain fatty acid transport protein